MKRNHIGLFVLFIFSYCIGFAQQPLTWRETRARQSGTITIYWYESQPFIARGESGMEGIEYELMEGFRRFVAKRYRTELNIKWVEAKSFADTYTSIYERGKPGEFAASAFSVTPERQQQVGFSPSYMADISVLITSQGIPIVKDREEFNKLFSKLTAITINGTTYEQDLERLKSEGQITFKTQYIPSSDNILKAIASRDSAFGFIDLPVYMMIFANDPAVNVKRQNMFPVKRKGYAFVYPLQSDWGEPLQEFFNDPEFHALLEKSIARYIDIELYRFIESLAIQSDDMVVLLTKEKEIQYNDLLGKSNLIVKEVREKNVLAAFATVTLMSLTVIIMLYTKRSQQKKKIETQRKSIEEKNQQLEKRNHHLVILDEEKNNLIKILAHDLRTPINHVQGLAQVYLLSNPTLDDEQKGMIQKINDAAIRLNKMINNILDIDSLENNRVKILNENVVIAPLVSQVVKSFEKQAIQKEIKLSLNCDAANLVVRGDSLFLIQIFENLIGNALKFSPRGGWVNVSVQLDKAHAIISVKDSGPGLTDEDRKLLFRKFQRLSAKPTDGEHSTGLGLFIVRKYVELMDGTVSVESGVGQGAKFIVDFPANG